VRKTLSRDIVVTEMIVFERFFYRHEMKNKKHSPWNRRRQRFRGGRDLSRKTHVNSWPAAAAEAHGSQPLTTYISARVEHRCSPINHSQKPVNHYFNKRAPLPLSPQNIYARQGTSDVPIIILLLYVYRRRRLLGGRLFVGPLLWVASGYV